MCNSKRNHWCVFLFLMASVIAMPGQAALIMFDDNVDGLTSRDFNGDGDSVNDIRFSTTDPAGWRTYGPMDSHLLAVHEPGLEGTTYLDPDLRVDFLFGAEHSVGFGFALNDLSDGLGNTATFELYDFSGNLLGSTMVVAALDQGFYVEGLVSLAFDGRAAYGLFDFNSTNGRYIIDNFVGTFGNTEVIPEPATVILFSLGIACMAVRRH